MSKALEAAAVSDAAFDGREFHAMSRADRERYLARSAKSILAFLDAAVVDEETADAVWSAAYDTWAEFGANDRDGGKAAILALKEAVNAG